MTKTKPMQAVLLILEKNSKILFGKRAYNRASLPGKWSLPSDKIEKNETPEQAVIRCAKHELGLELKLKDIKFYDLHHYNDGKEVKDLYFARIPYKGMPRICDRKELVSLAFYTFKEFFEKYKDSQIGHGLQYLRREHYEDLCSEL
jgi:ADP-ribose pyrophosphatase YjhB (NUDIX family)